MHGLTQQDLINAVASHNQNMGAGFIEKNGAQWLMRLPGQAESLQQLGAAPLVTSGGAVLTVADVAKVTDGKELRTGAATQNGREVVLSTVFMLIGENSQK